MLLAIDPGVSTGWALFDDTGRLQSCGLGDPPGAPCSPPGPNFFVPCRVVIERPRIYPGGRTKNPNDVLSVALNAGEWAGQYLARGHSVTYVSPQQWKGNVPKAVHHPRIWTALTGKEQNVLSDAGKGIAPSKRHNIIDAVGIGLWAVRSVRGPK